MVPVPFLSKSAKASLYSASDCVGVVEAQVRRKKSQYVSSSLLHPLALCQAASWKSARDERVNLPSCM